MITNPSGLSVQSPTNKLLPNSTITALEEIEDELLSVKQELAFLKKECQNLKSDNDTIVQIATTQHSDIQRYLDKEIRVLDDVINKQSKRQEAEHTRLKGQATDVKNVLRDLDSSRMECVRKLNRVEQVLGVHTDPNETFRQPLSGV